MSSPESLSAHGIQIFTTCPQSKDLDRRDYLRRVIDISQWSEEFHFDGMLIYTDNGLVDPWLVAQVVVQNTKRLMPLVAVQPIYMHPYAVAKLVSSIAHLHDRRIALNMLAGGFRNDLTALGDTTEHDNRYLRTTEYTQIIRRLLENDGATSLTGTYYAVKNLKLTPPLAPEFFPEILISGSSSAGMAAAKAIGATAIRYPQPVKFEAAERAALATWTKCGVRVGVIARDSDEEAWRVAHERFPEDRRGQDRAPACDESERLGVAQAAVDVGRARALGRRRLLARPDAELQDILSLYCRHLFARRRRAWTLHRPGLSLGDSLTSRQAGTSSRMWWKPFARLWTWQSQHRRGPEAPHGTTRDRVVHGVWTAPGRCPSLLNSGRNNRRFVSSTDQASDSAVLRRSHNFSCTFNRSQRRVFSLSNFFGRPQQQVDLTILGRVSP